MPGARPKARPRRRRWVQKVLNYSSGARLLSVGRLIPKSWRYVIIEVVEANEKEVVVRLRRAELIWG